MWVDAFHAGLRNSTETSAVVAAARAANCNAIFVQVRKRGDAYYRNGLEPVATDVAAGFDPLGDLIQRAHNGTERIEVHAWMVSFNIWNNVNTPPSQATHPYNLHPDWLSQNNTGTQWDGVNYQFDPGHPAVQQHTFDVAMDILQRYDIDGLHLDYIRYSENGGAAANSQPWGYNPVTVARFKKLKGVASTPSPSNSTWLQWRRDQVTALVRKIYLNAWATKPNVRISAALIPWGNPPADLTLTAWRSTDAYSRVLQDWRGWMEEGILDLACPMIYRTDTSGFTGWANYTKDMQFSRAGAVGAGWYLNSIANTISQIKVARIASPGGKTAAGVLGYSYAVPNKDGVSQSTTWKALTDDTTAESYDPGGTPVFGTLATVPSMPWKTSTTKGHAMGYVRNNANNAVFDGAAVSISGPVSRTLTTDGTGFFGAVDLPVGTYTLTVSMPGFRPVTRSFSVTGATVAQPTVQVEMLPFEITSTIRSATGTTLTITWNSVPGRTYRVEASNDLSQWSSVASGVAATNGSTTYQWTVPTQWQSQAFLRVTEEP